MVKLRSLAPLFDRVMNDAVSADDGDRINNAHKLSSIGSDRSISDQAISSKSFKDEVIAP